MGWSNTIPNPFTVGGGGLAGSILVYDANNVLVGRIDENGMVAYGDGGSFVGLFPSVPNEFYGDTAGIKLQPNNPGTKPPILTDGQILGGWAGGALTPAPVLSLNSPSLEVATNEMMSFIDIYAPNRSTNSPGSIAIFAAGNASDNPYVDVTPQLSIQSFIVGASNDAVSAFSGGGSTNSGAFSNAPTPNSLNLIKLNTASHIEVSYTATCYGSGAGDHVFYGVRINGVDYDVCGLYFNQANVHLQVAGTVRVGGGLGGGVIYSCVARWKRYAGGSAVGIVRDGNDFCTFIVKEVN